EIISEAAESEWRKPRRGDDVSVHYVGTLASDGSQFDSSRDRGQPFVFALGKGNVIKGWDLGVAGMKKGEIAKFTLAPEFAYGESGSPPKIPEKATLVFEIELLSWMSKDDLFGDEGVVKAEIKAGSGWKAPKEGEEIRCSVTAKAADGSIIEEKSDVEYSLGSGTFGPLSKAVDKAFKSMKRGSEVSLTCTKDYMYGDERPDGGSIDLTLHELYEVKDVSLSKDKSIMKKQVKEGEGHESPKDSNKVKLLVVAATDGTVTLPGFTSKTLEFTAGSGEVCDALECSVLEMKKGERAIVTCTRPASCVETQLGFSAPASEKVVLTVELVDFEKGKDIWSMSEEEKVEFGLARKDVGSALFKQGRTELALERYKKVMDVLSYIDNFKDDAKAKAKALKKVCELNKAACHLKLKQLQDAKKACNNVLKDDRQNVKALFRRAQAAFGLYEFSECSEDLRHVLVIEPENREAKVLLKQAQAEQKKEDQKVKGMFAKMCKGLSSPATAKK
ncbi:unnamed protein product, partial [Polarella glacialis]